jgi:hypothetical protein
MKICDSMGNCPIPDDWWNLPKNAQEMGTGEITSAVRTAYRYSSRIRSVGDSVLVVGPGPAFTHMEIMMWVDKSTRTIESAYPIYS